MSKSKKNVVDPQDIIDTYGADAARLFILSDSPPERDLEWTASGIEGAWKYINKLHRALDAAFDALPPVGTPKPDSFSDKALELRRATHQAIAGVAEDIEAFHMNKAVARIREFSNYLISSCHSDAGRNPPAEQKDPVLQRDDDSFAWALREGYESLVILFNPMMPHLAEEMWSKLGHTTLLTETPWTEVEKDLLKNDTITIGVQVNGKVRATITLAADAPKDEAEKIALNDPNVQKAIAGQTVKKVIVVPGRIVNVVAG